jgi:Arc/MetJ-type ribon-helix-helix transcriptional regulator
MTSKGEADGGVTNARQERPSLSSFSVLPNVIPMGKVAISLEDGLLRRVDALVGRKVFPNRSKAIAEAVREKLQRLDRSRLARECAKLDPKFEQALAEEGLSRELDEWPEY